MSRRTRWPTSSTSTTGRSSRPWKRGCSVRDCRGEICVTPDRAAAAKDRSGEYDLGCGCGGGGSWLPRRRLLRVGLRAPDRRLRLRRECLVELLLRRLSGSVRDAPSAVAEGSPASEGGVPSGIPFSSTICPTSFMSTGWSPYISSSGVSCQSGIGTCVWNCSTGRLATATVMKSWKARAGAVPPCSPAIGLASSRPIQTPVVRPLEKPMNQPSLFDGGGAGLAGDGSPDLRCTAGVRKAQPTEEGRSSQRRPRARPARDLRPRRAGREYVRRP